MQKKKYILVFLIFLIFLGTSFHVYRNLKNESQALRLRIQIMERGKKTPRPWSALLDRNLMEPNLREPALERPELENEQVEPPELESPELEGPLLEEPQVESPELDGPVLEAPFDEVETVELARALEARFDERGKLSPEELDLALAIADELIDREPNTFSVYKAKLILLLAKELEHGEPVGDDEIDGLLETMASFDLYSNKLLKREAFLIARTDSKIDQHDSDIVNLEDEIAEIDAAIETSVDDPNALAQLKVEREVLNLEREELILSANALEEKLEDDVLENDDYLNDDIVQIPFLRELAKGDYDLVTLNALNFIEFFPESITGYFFLIRARELSGDIEGAWATLLELDLLPEKMEELEERLERSREVDIRDFWKNLRF